MATVTELALREEYALTDPATSTFGLREEYLVKDTTAVLSLRDQYTLTAASAVIGLRESYELAGVEPDCFLVWAGERIPSRMRIATADGRYP